MTDADKSTYKQLVYPALGACQEVHKHLGPFLNEYMYQDALAIEHPDGSLIEGVKNAREQEREQEGGTSKGTSKKARLGSRKGY